MSGALLPAARATITTFLLALTVAIVLGTVLGLLVGGIRTIDRALNPTLEFARAMPPAAVIPIATLLIGYNEQMKVAVVSSAAIWPILFNSRAALGRLDPVLIETARSLHLTTLQRVRKITFPALLPGIFLGVRIGGPIALVVTLLVEFLTQVDGIGGLIATARAATSPTRSGALSSSPASSARSSAPSSPPSRTTPSVTGARPSQRRRPKGSTAIAAP